MGTKWVEFKVAVFPKMRAIGKMAAHGYEYDGSRGLYEMEVQSHELFYIPLERGEQPVLDFHKNMNRLKQPGSSQEPFPWQIGVMLEGTMLPNTGSSGRSLSSRR